MDAKQQMPRRAHWSVAITGALGLAVGLIAIGIEIARNWEYGMTSGGAVVAATYALFAVGLAVIPGIATRSGWHAGLVALQLGCMALTGFFGLSYYAGGILEKTNAARNATAQYRDARQAIDTARADANRAQAAADAIAENTPAAELQRLADAAMSRSLAEADAKRGGCGTLCKAAEKEAADYLRRKADASAKEAALARMAAAQTRLDTEKARADRGTVDASPLATLAAMQLGGDADAIAAHIDTFEPIAMVVIMLLFASLVHPSLCLLLQAISGEVDQPAPMKIKPVAAKSAARAEAAKRGRKPMTPEERVLQFVSERLRAGMGEITGSELYEAFAEWWRVMCPGVTMPSMVAMSKLVTEQAGIARARRGGRTRYAAKLVH